MAPNPCLGLISLRLGAMLMSLLSIGRAICCFVVVSTFLVFATAYKDWSIEQLDNYGIQFEFIRLPTNEVVGITTFLLGVFVLEMPFFLFIFLAARAANLRRCLYWWRTKIFLMSVAIVVGVVAAILMADKLFIAFFGIAALLYDFYLLWVIKAYVNEMQMEEDVSRAARMRPKI